MGCGSSTETKGSTDANNNKLGDTERSKRGEGPKLTAEPNIENIHVPRTERGYPVAKPPPNKKGDIFFPAKMKLIDNHARQVPIEKAIDFQLLIKSLTEKCRNDLESLRAIFVWLGSQPVDDLDYSDAKDNTPLGFLKLIRDEEGTLTGLFTLLCREAKIPCVLVSGWGKSVGYEVGDPEERIKELNNTWTAVFVQGGWRIIHPFWAFRGVAGYSSGAFTKVEEKGVAVRQKEYASSGVDVVSFNEYYFLTDPEQFVYTSLASDPKWQLLSRPWNITMFAGIPLCEQAFHEESVKITRGFQSILKTVDGECSLELTSDDLSNLSMDYELFYNNKESEQDISPDLQLNNYVFLDRSNSKWCFVIRFPQAGVYKIKIIGGRFYETLLCSFKLVCDVAKDNCKPLPFNPGQIGYGPNIETENAGVTALSHKTGLVRVKTRKTVEFNFALSKNVTVRSELYQSEMRSEELEQLQRNVKETRTRNNLKVHVTVPEQGEYALKLHAQKNGEATSRNVCNYLLATDQKKKKTRTWETPDEKNTRKDISHYASTPGTEDIAELESAIERFEKLELEDQAAYDAAVDALEEKKVRKELKDAINRRHLKTLDKAIDTGQRSRFREKKKVATLLTEAEDVRDHLRHLKRISHDVLAMKQPTISELRSYIIPPPVIMAIMKTTYLVLGEREAHLEDWDDIKALMGKLGKDSLLRLVKQFDTVHVQPNIRYKMEKMLKEHSEEEARLASAGAGTFYVWLSNISKALDEEDRREHSRHGNRHG